MQNGQTEDILWGWHVGRKPGRLDTWRLSHWCLHLLLSFLVRPYPTASEVNRNLSISIDGNWIRSQMLPTSEVYSEVYCWAPKCTSQRTSLWWAWDWTKHCNAALQGFLSPRYPTMPCCPRIWPNDLKKLKEQMVLKIRRVRKQYLTIHSFKLLDFSNRREHHFLK